jgi:hypothetical protein
MASIINYSLVYPLLSPQGWIKDILINPDAVKSQDLGKGEWWREWIQLWYIVRTFVTVTMYPQNNNNNNKRLKKKVKNLKDSKYLCQKCL